MVSNHQRWGAPALESARRLGGSGRWRGASRAFSTDAASSSPRVAALASALRDGPSLDEFASGLAAIPACAGGGAAPAPARRAKPARERLPEWLKVDRPSGEEHARIKKQMRSLKLATVCEEARCPNIGECWGGKKGTATATIMVMGDTCTRGCRFCNVKTSRTPAALDPNEPLATAEAIASWAIDYVVITSVDRDDLPDHGAGHLAQVIRTVKAHKPSLMLECLSPDFAGDLSRVSLVANAGLNVFAHNLETTERLTPTVRDRRAHYRQSLAVLEGARAAAPSVVTKTSVMLGCGEEAAEVRQTMRDALNAGVEIFTLGQYLRPSKRHMPVSRMLPPAEYEMWRQEGMAMGFKFVASGPLVRSSYKAGEVFLEAFAKERAAEVKAAQAIGQSKQALHAQHAQQAQAAAQ